MSHRAIRLPGLAVLAALVAGSSPSVAVEAPTTLRGLAEVSAAVNDARVLRRLPSLARSTRLSGEIDALTWPVWVTADEAAMGAKLRLAHVAAVSVMPEASQMAVAINGRPISEFHIASGAGNRVVELAVPAGTLKPGWNAIRVGVDQRHRVECTTAATYELWTEIDRAHSGLVFPAGHMPERRSIADIAGIAPDERGRVALRLVMPDTVEPRQMERGLAAVQALALIGGFLDPVVSVTRRVDAAPGIDVVLGRATLGLGDAGASAQAGSVTVFDDTDPGHLVVALAGDDATVDRAVAQLVDLSTAGLEGTDEGVQARIAVGGRAVASGDRMSLGELGATSTEFSGRLFRTGFDVRLPADLYPADYAKVQLKLAGGHAPGLDRASRLTVRVNGRQAAGLPIVAPRGEIFTDKTLQIPLSFFRPGHNRIEIEAATPTAADKTCDSAVQIDGPKRFLFVDRSEIRFPRFARLARLPDLTATASGVLEALAADARPSLHVPHPDLATLSAAATFATRIAVAAGRVTPPSVLFRNPSADTASAIVVGAFADLPATVIGAVGLEMGQVRAAWGRRPASQPLAAITPTPGPDVLARRVTALRVAGLPGDGDPIVTGSIQGRVLTVAPPRDGDLVDRWRKSMESPWSPAAFSREAGQRLEKMLGLLPSFGAGRPIEGLSPTASTGLVVAQAMTAAGGAWTLVTAPSSAILSDAVTAVTGGDGWTRMAGAAMTWDQVEEKVATLPTAQYGYLSTSGFDFANLRLVAAALASDYPFGYILAAFLVTAGLGLATARLLPRVGVAKR